MTEFILNMYGCSRQCCQNKHYGTLETEYFYVLIIMFLYFVRLCVYFHQKQINIYIRKIMGKYIPTCPDI